MLHQFLQKQTWKQHKCMHSFNNQNSKQTGLLASIGRKLNKWIKLGDTSCYENSTIYPTVLADIEAHFFYKKIKK